MKVDINGNLIWSNTITHGSFNTYRLFDVTETVNHELVLTGYYSSSMLIAKIDSMGNLLWSNLYQSGNSENAGFTIKEYNNNYLVLGYKHDFPPSVTTNILLLIDTAGNPISTKSFNFINSNMSSMGGDMIIKDNHIVMLLNPNNSMALIEIDSSGNYFWYNIFNYDNYGCFDCNGNKLHSTQDGGYIFSTFAELGMGGYITKTDSAGNLEWKKQIQSKTLKAFQLEDKSYLILGNGPLGLFKSTFQIPAHIGLVKTDSLGNAAMCSSNFITLPLNDNLIVTNSTFSFQTGGLMTSISPIISTIDLYEFAGCVDFTSGINELNNSHNIKIYPNPASDFIHFEFKDKIKNKASILIYNLFGEIIYKNKIDDLSNLTINVSNLRSGLYLWEVSNEEIVQRGKFIKH